MEGGKQPRQHHSGFSLSSMPKTPPRWSDQCSCFIQDDDKYSRPTPGQCGSTPWSFSSWEVDYTGCYPEITGREGATQIVWDGPALRDYKVVYTGNLLSTFVFLSRQGHQKPVPGVNSYSQPEHVRGMQGVGGAACRCKEDLAPGILLSLTQHSPGTIFNMVEHFLDINT